MRVFLLPSLSVKWSIALARGDVDDLDLVAERVDKVEALLVLRQRHPRRCAGDASIVPVTFSVASSTMKILFGQPPM